MIGKEHKGLKLKVEEKLLGKIGTLMNEKWTKMIEKEQKGGNVKNKTYFIMGTKTLNDDWKGTKRPEVEFSVLLDTIKTHP